jgi:predicted nuclease of predicted toxin-antitoxin system
MSLGLYMDVHVPAAVTDGLRRRGVDVLTSQEDGTRESDDPELLQRATELGRVLFSQDEDLLRVATDWQRIGQPFAGLVFAHQLGTSIGRSIEDLELIARCCTVDELFNRTIYLPLR